MIGKIYINGVIGVDTTLVDVVRQVKNQPLATSFLVKVHSEGGYVEDGFDIYDYLKNLDKEKPVTTSTTMAYSIASVVFMAGSTRLIPNNANQVYMIHLPWMEVVGDSIVINDYLNGLKDAENRLINFYTDALSIDKGTIHSLLKNETYLNADECLDFGIATGLEVPLKAVAKLHNNENENNESLMNKLTKKLDAIWNKLNGIKAELVLQDATGVELVFPDLEASDVASVDAKVTVDGQPAEGDFLMPDGSTVVAKGGVVTEIKPAEDAQPTDPAENAEADARIENADEIPADPAEKDKMIEELQAKVAELQSKLDEMMTSADASNLLEAFDKSLEKQAELEAKFQALAKSIGSDYTTTTSENNPTIKAKEQEKPTISFKRK
ncbi:ATP-dependent Clp protease proteolytic subunit [Flavobacterium sp. SM15]|uniref:ATP-dependent Clp protease proteolytic subunit n=1 Tax=Flavobacterium sp. SM15 TaxID=2908005 RepID=UPI001EDA5A5B|nr:ATP-dependent Clp protease proteolytic subunit [Flavobacterium sp. SM15]MCG2611502.1 ATP-dependent Clp protease proteolytic subunit [Flavobacterium sp. SM15]